MRNPFKITKRKQTKGSCLANAVVSLLCAVLAAWNILNGKIDPEAVSGLAIFTGILFAVSVYWFYRWNKMGKKDAGTPQHPER